MANNKQIGEWRHIGDAYTDYQVSFVKGVVNTEDFSRMFEKLQERTANLPIDWKEVPQDEKRLSAENSVDTPMTLSFIRAFEKAWRKELGKEPSAGCPRIAEILKDTVREYPMRFSRTVAQQETLRTEEKAMLWYNLPRTEIFSKDEKWTKVESNARYYDLSLEREPVAHVNVRGSGNDNPDYKTLNEEVASEFAQALNNRDGEGKHNDPLAGSEMFFFRGLRLGGSEEWWPRKPHNNIKSVDEHGLKYASSGTTFAAQIEPSLAEQIKNKTFRREIYGHSCFLGRMHLSAEERLLVWYDPNFGVAECPYRKPVGADLSKGGLLACLKKLVGCEDKVKINKEWQQYIYSSGPYGWLESPLPNGMESWQKMARPTGTMTSDLRQRESWEIGFRLEDFSLYAVQGHDITKKLIVITITIVILPSLECRNRKGSKREPNGIPIFVLSRTDYKNQKILKEEPQYVDWLMFPAPTAHFLECEVCRIRNSDQPSSTTLITGNREEIPNAGETSTGSCCQPGTDKVGAIAQTGGGQKSTL